MNENELHNQSLNLQEKERSVTTANQNSSVARVMQIISFLFIALQMLLTLRLILHLVGANAGNGFANLIDTLSAPFVVFFASLVQNPKLGGTAVLEVTTIIAMIVYSILAWLIVQLVWLMLSRPR